MTDATALDGWAPLDRLELEMAVLDRRGVIVAVNDAWARFARENGGRREACCEGASYLAVCSADPDPRSTAVAAAIRAAVNGELLAPFTTEVACHAPRRACWFQVTVAGRRSPAGDPDGAVVTVAPSSPAAARANPPPAPADEAVSGPAIPAAVGDAELRALVDAAPDGLALTDADGELLFTNRTFETIFGYGRGELLGRQVELLVPTALAGAHRAHRLRYRAGPTSRQMAPGLEVDGVRRDGVETPVEITLSPLHLAVGLRIVVAVRHRTFNLDAAVERRLASHALASVGDLVFALDAADLSFTYVNDSTCAHLGYGRGELLDGMTPAHVMPDLTLEELRRRLAPLTAGETRRVELPVAHLARDGRRLPLTVIYEQVAGLDRRLFLAVARPSPPT
ncbi:MAG: PAS domain-containing protein [Acidimicrobiales bacterium]